jgi:hypothetical protein
VALSSWCQYNHLKNREIPSFRSLSYIKPTNYCFIKKKKKKKKKRKKKKIALDQSSRLEQLTSLIK